MWSRPAMTSTVVEGGVTVTRVLAAVTGPSEVAGARSCIRLNSSGNSGDDSSAASSGEDHYRHLASVDGLCESSESFFPFPVLRSVRFPSLAFLSLWRAVT